MHFALDGDPERPRMQHIAHLSPTGFAIRGEQRMSQELEQLETFSIRPIR